ERLQRKESINADAEHLRVGAIERRERIAERAELLRAYRAEGRREERQHHGTPAEGAERHRLPLIAHQGKVRSLRSNVYAHEASHRHAEGRSAVPRYTFYDGPD